MAITGKDLLFEVSQFAALRLARYEFRLRAGAETVLQSLLGSALRGAFGHSWKTVVCAAGPGERAGCFLREVCLRPGECEYSFFKPQAGRGEGGGVGEPTGPKLSETPRPYIFEPPIPPLTREVSARATMKVRIPEGGVLPFRLTLLGEGQSELANVVAAVALLAKRGLGATRAPFTLERVTALDVDDRRATVYEPRSGCFSPRPEAVKGLDALVGERLRELPVGDAVTVRFLTPTRIRTGGRVRDRVSFAELVGYLSRRVRLLAELYGSRPMDWNHAALLERAGRVACSGADLWLHRAERYSESRQGKIEQGGLLGEMSFRGGTVGEFLPLLVAGEFLHVGSSTSFGLGCYRVVV